MSIATAASPGPHNQHQSSQRPLHIDLLFSVNKKDNTPVYTLQTSTSSQASGGNKSGKQTEADEGLARKLKGLTVTRTLEEDVELSLLLATLPASLRDPIIAFLKSNDDRQLVEVVIDTGRPPVLWFQDDTNVPAQREVEEVDLESCLGALLSDGKEWTSDNRIGISKSLHRISAVRNRHNKVIGYRL